MSEQATVADVDHRRWLDGFCRIKEAARLRSVSEDTILRLINRGKLKTYEIGERAIGLRRREVLMLDAE
jgi:excisionase family DNA binding protein